MEKQHVYAVSMRWTGNQGQGTKDYRSYSRDHIHQAAGKADIPGSSDPSFRGSPNRYNPEELMVSALSSCHMLWYLHLCSVNQVVVNAYEDRATGIMIEKADGSGYFQKVELHPAITLADASMQERAISLHEEAHRMCFIANSVNFPVEHHPVFTIAGQ